MCHFQHSSLPEGAEPSVFPIAYSLMLYLFYASSSSLCFGHTSCAKYLVLLSLVIAAFALANLPTLISCYCLFWHSPYHTHIHTYLYIYIHINTQTHTDCILVFVLTKKCGSLSWRFAKIHICILISIPSHLFSTMRLQRVATLSSWHSPFPFFNLHKFHTHYILVLCLPLSQTHTSTHSTNQRAGREQSGSWWAAALFLVLMNEIGIASVHLPNLVNSLKAH